MAAIADILQGQLNGGGAVDPLYTSTATRKLAFSVSFKNKIGDSTELVLYVNGDTVAHQWGGVTIMDDEDQVIWDGVVGPGDDIRASSSNASTPVNWTLTILRD